MTLPYDCGLTLPTPQRYTNQQFRRVSRWVAASQMDVADGVALTAAEDLFGGEWKAMRHAFHWTSKHMRGQVDKIRERFWDQSQIAIMENHENFQLEDGLALLSAMRDGGWRRGTLPPLVKLSLISLRDERDYTLGQIAERSGLKYDQIAWITRTKVNRNAGRAAALAGLAVAG